jgi:TetR/AcrR family transcriptional repressor of mexJK operon
MDKDSQANCLRCGKPAGRPRASEVEARTHNLIHTAGMLFLRHGYSKVSLEAIAREAHVAVRTIYVKFGGKAGLLNAVLVVNRERFFDMQQMETDARPLKQVIDQFSERFLDLITAPEAISMQRMVIAEAAANPELARTYFEAGPRQVRDMLGRYFARPDVRAQLRDDLPYELLPVHLLNSVVGDPVSRYLFGPSDQGREAILHGLHQRLALFYRSVLRQP